MNLPPWPLPMGVLLPSSLARALPGDGLRLELVRFCSRPSSTTGSFFAIEHGCRRFLCFTLEDQHRAGAKVPGATRIPAGTYRLKLRTEGDKHQGYLRRFGPMHRGMIELCDVPNFRYILLHLGNTAGDTAGCIPVADQAHPQDDRILASEVAYRRIYPPIAARLEAGEEVWLSIIDYDTPPEGP